MKYSKLFGKTRKNVPAEAVSINHKLLLQAGFVDQLSAGVFSWLPLGLKVLRKIDNVIREELNAIGGQEVAMPSLIQKSQWEITGRWDRVDVLFKTKSQTDKEYALGFSHEEVITPLAAQYIHSYKDLPLALYQIQTKFRDELRAKSGVLRGREFGMKDLYSFHESSKDFERFYEEVKKAYLKIFKRLGLNEVKISEASGGAFTKKLSHEFNVLTTAGEVDLLYCTNCTFAQNTEITNLKAGDECIQCHKSKLLIGKAIEVGNIFDLGEKFAKDFNLTFMNNQGQKQHCVMGCYGIGNTRLVGTIVEMYNDEKGIIWPKEVAPFRAHMITLGDKQAEGEALYDLLTKQGIDVLWDDRDVSPGVKFADCDLIGIPIRLVISKKTGDKIEIKLRSTQNIQIVTIQEVVNILK